MILRFCIAFCALFGTTACTTHPVSPLAAAARSGRSDLIAKLVSAGANPDEGSGVNGWSPIMHAIHKRQPGSVQALVKAGANVNLPGYGGETPLMMAAGYGYTEIVNDLLAAHADPYAARQDGDTALDFAVLGVADIDEFTLGRCHLSTVFALVDKAPGLKLHNPSAVKQAVAAAKLKGCAGLTKLLGHS